MKKIKTKNGCYYAFRGDPGWEKISNFNIEIKHKLIYKDEVKREIVFTSRGNETKPFILESECMATIAGFKAFCLKKGDYLFEGSSSDLSEIWKLEFESKEDEPKVYLIDGGGYIKEQKVWLFENMAIKGKKVVIPDGNGIFWVKRGKGLKINPLSAGRPLPKLKKITEGFDIKKEISIAEEALNRNIGGFNGSIIIGYIVASVYSRIIYRNLGFFPILFAYGKYQNFFGFDMSYATSAQENTQTGISRLLNYYSHIPVWIDEYRNSDKIKRMSGYFRNVYNKVTPVKAKREETGIRDVQVYGNLVLSGEEMPLDPALRSRCFPVNLSSKSRKDDMYSRVLKLSRDFSKITYSLIKDINKENATELIRSIHRIKDGYISQSIDSRQAEVFAVIVSGRKFLEKYASLCNGFDEWIISQLKNENKRREEESPLNIFWETVEGLISKGSIQKGLHIQHDKKTWKIYIWFAELYREYEKETRFKKDETVKSRQAILDQLAEEPYCIYKNKSKRISGATRSCVVLDYRKSPENIQRLARRPI